MSATIAGRRPVLEALRAGQPLEVVMIASGVRPSGVLDEIRRLAARAGVRVEEVPRQALDRRAGGRHQGVVALGRGPRPVGLDQLLERAQRRGEPALLVAVDGVTDPRNLGAVARSAEAAGAHGLVVPRRRSAPLSAAAHKAAAGALAHLPVAEVPNLRWALERLRQEGVWGVVLDAGGRISLWDLELATDPLCLVVGSEGRGVSRLVRERADVVVAIPMRGAVASLNVSVAAGIALFEVARRRRLALGTPPRQGGQSAGWGQPPRTTGS